jgi:ABC-type multidrug transport system fused ATPase/permease subunit
MDALDAVGLASMVRALPRGLDTLVAEGGANFSGGQRQRIALARLLIARTPIVLLDEPFAALDPETEASLQNTLFGAFSDRTLVVITHHLQGIERFDRVAFIEDGRVEMEGAPADLASANARFRKLLAFDRGI